MYKIKTTHVGSLPRSKKLSEILFKKDKNEDALGLKHEIEKRMENIKKGNSEPNVGSLKELKSLVDEGVITEEEFQLKRKQILNI